MPMQIPVESLEENMKLRLLVFEFEFEANMMRNTMLHIYIIQ